MYGLVIMECKILTHTKYPVIFHCQKYAFTKLLLKNQLVSKKKKINKLLSTRFHLAVV